MVQQAYKSLMHVKYKVFISALNEVRIVRPFHFYVTSNVIYNGNYLFPFYCPIFVGVSHIVSVSSCHLFDLMISYHPVSLVVFLLAVSLTLLFSFFVLVVVIVGAYHVVVTD